MEHNSGVYQGAFFRQDVVGSAVLLVLQDLSQSVHTLAKKLDVDIPVLTDENGVLNQDEYFTKGHANVMAQAKAQEEAKKAGTVPAQQPLIVKPDDQEVVEFGGDYEDSGTKNTPERQAAQ